MSIEKLDWINKQHIMHSIESAPTTMDLIVDQLESALASSSLSPDPFIKGNEEHLKAVIDLFKVTQDRIPIDLTGSYFL